VEITLAIPNYNGSENIANILNQVSKEDFHKIYFIDDASEDNSLEIADKFSKVTIIRGEKNLGPAGNRNRVLNEDLGDIVMFLDVDMELKNTDLKSKIINSFQDNKVAIVGGKIFSKKDEPMWWNYGSEIHPILNAKSEIIHDWFLTVWGDMEKIKELEDKYGNITPNFEISFGNITEPKEVDWVSEANFCIRTDLFKKVAGFDGKMRYHADQDLCKRIRFFGYKVLFSPNIKTRHLEIDTFGEDRKYIMKKYAFYYYNKHWGMSKDIFDKLYPDEKKLQT
jgi:GT2 family glycosyltransferase